jgi:chromosome partitioning protein
MVRMAELHTIAIANQRRGAGKTTTALSLGMTLAERGVRVLLADLDPQAALTVVCGVKNTEFTSIAEVLGGSLPGKVGMWDILRDVLPSHYCFIAPSDMALAQSELGLAYRLGREGVFKKALRCVSKDFDVAIVDCPSSLGLLTINALNAAEAVLIPTRPELAHLRGIYHLSTVVERIKQDINPNLSILGILVTGYNHSLDPHQKAVSAIRAAGLPLLPIGIDRSAISPFLPTGRNKSSIRLPVSPQTRIKLAEFIEDWLEEQRAHPSTRQVGSQKPKL